MAGKDTPSSRFIIHQNISHSINSTNPCLHSYHSFFFNQVLTIPLLSSYKSTTTLDIAKISPAVFYLNLRRPENKLFTVSLYKLDYELEQYELLDEPANEAEIDQKLPAYLQEYRSAFLKAASDELPLSRLD